MPDVAAKQAAKGAWVERSPALAAITPTTLGIGAASHHGH